MSPNLQWRPVRLRTCIYRFLPKILLRNGKFPKSNLSYSLTRIECFGNPASSQSIRIHAPEKLIVEMGMASFHRMANNLLADFSDFICRNSSLCYGQVQFCLQDFESASVVMIKLFLNSWLYMLICSCERIELEEWIPFSSWIYSINIRSQTTNCVTVNYYCQKNRFNFVFSSGATSWITVRDKYLGWTKVTDSTICSINL